MRLRKALLACALLVAASSATTLALGSHRIAAEQAAYAGPSAGRCTPTTLNRSAVLPDTTIAVSPLPDSYDASPQTQISLLGTPADTLSDVTVRGSESGRHAGRLEAYSQGDGASFVPSSAFRAGETVTVRGRVRAGRGEQSFAFHFTVAHPDPIPIPASAPVTSFRDPDEMQHFVSRPELLPPVTVVSTDTAQATAGDIFSAPYNGPGPSGPMISEADGNLVWFDRLPSGMAATNLQVQQLDGQPVLTWWQGYIPPQGFGEGEEVIYNTHYREIGSVRPGNGYKADLHDFHLMANDTALLTVFAPIHCDLSSLGGPSDGAVTDALYEEVDLRTGLVRRQWHSVDHVPLSASYSSAVGSSVEWPFDYFHLNSIDQLAGGDTLISARNTSAMYELNSATGQIIETIGGRSPSVQVASGAATAYQHDATVLPNGTISVFDNGGVPKVHAQSRGLLLSVNPQAGTDTPVTEFDHQPSLLSGSQGNVQQLGDGDFFIGWGAEPYFSEYSASGQLLYDAHMHGSYQSYRAYRFAWTGEPSEPPAVAASATGSATTVYASWNGDTRTASWRVLGGSSAKALAPVASARRSGFETAIRTPAAERYVAVQALGANGEVLGSSRTIAG